MFQLEALLTPGLTLCKAPGISKKRLFETAAAFITAEHPELQDSEIYGSLLTREKLGSTGLGNGIAIPHCRISGCDEAIVALITLDQGIDFDAPDGKPVDLLFLLLVPEEAQQEHLNILAGLAQLLDNDEFCAVLRSADDEQALYDGATRFKLPP
jgi:PTS system nitrogen regulatory IIA component